MSPSAKRRILIVDDQPSIHQDYRKILAPAATEHASLAAAEAELFGDQPPKSEQEWDIYEIDSAFQGEEAIAMVQQSLAEGRPYAVAFVDIRMPPGCDGIQTLRRCWELDHDLLGVICSAYSDYCWEDIVRELGRTDRFLILRKPFENIEVRQCAAALSERFAIAHQSKVVESQKLESIGQLAAGIAHEINTPIQFIGDNTRFLKEAFGNLREVISACERALQSAERAAIDGDLVSEARAVAEAVDLAYLCDEVPKSIDQSLEGIDRVAKIVRAMKEFSHPDTGSKTPIDINQAIQCTLTVARNEWKHVAEVVLDLDRDLPRVSGLGGALNQVILNLVVNAAHAIGEVVGKNPTSKGHINISTRTENDLVVIRIGDTGAGIPPAIRSKIFDPFFTTKPVGKGTGQGLAIAYTVIVKKHGGTISFESEVGCGTTFIIRLPIDDQIMTTDGSALEEAACTR